MGREGSRGGNALIVEEDENGERRPKTGNPPTASSQQAGAQQERRKKKSRSQDTELGSALRTVYRETIEEQIPQEMLDLLGKLG